MSAAFNCVLLQRLQVAVVIGDRAPTECGRFSVDAHSWWCTVGYRAPTECGRFSVDAHSWWCTVASNRLRRWCCLAFHRSRYTDHCCTSSTRLNWSTSSRNIGSTLINTLTICNCISVCQCVPLVEASIATKCFDACFVDVEAWLKAQT